MAVRLQSSLKTAALLGAAVFFSSSAGAEQPSRGSTVAPAEDPVGVSFSAVMRGDSGTLIGLQRLEGDRETRWLEPGESFAGWTFVRLETEKETPRAVLKHADEEIQLGLRESVIVGGPAEVAGSTSEDARLKRDLPVHYLLSQSALAAAKRDREAASPAKPESEGAGAK
jgi:hypothetical protein